MIDAQDIIDDAIDALASAKTEARQRTVVSRAYYAAYHFLLAHTCGQPFATGATGRKGGLHRDFIAWLYKSRDPCVVSVAHKLDTLFDDRVQADYKINVHLPAKMAQDAVSTASEIIDVDLKSYNAVLDKRTYP